MYPSPFARPLDELSLPLLTIGDSVARTVDLQFQMDSRLLIVDATPIQDIDHLSYTHYFLWDGNRWKLLRRVLLTEWKPARER